MEADESRCNAWLKTALTGRRRCLFDAVWIAVVVFSLLFESISVRDLPKIRFKSTDEVMCNLHCSIPDGKLANDDGKFVELRFCGWIAFDVGKCEEANLGGLIGCGDGLISDAAWKAFSNTDSISSTWKFLQLLLKFYSMQWK